MFFFSLVNELKDEHVEVFIAIYEDTNGAKILESVMVLICPMYSNTNLPMY